VLDTWDVIYLEGGKAGSIQTSVMETDHQGQKILKTSVDLQLLVKRNNQLIKLHQETGTDETPEGKVTGTFMKQVLGLNKELIIVGQVNGRQLELLQNGKAGVMKPAPWDSAAVGLYQQ